jgi:hypothetical protein
MIAASKSTSGNQMRDGAGTFRAVKAVDVREGDVVVAAGCNSVRLMVRKVTTCPDGGVRLFTNGAEQRLSALATVMVRSTH